MMRAQEELMDAEAQLADRAVRLLDRLPKWFAAPEREVPPVAAPRRAA